MSGPEPAVGGTFFIRGEEGEDEALEVEEVCEGPNEDGEWNVASDGNFYDVKWNDERQRFEENGNERPEE